MNFQIIFIFRKLIFNLFLLILFVLPVFIFLSCQKTTNDDSHIQWLKDNAVNIRTIDPDNEDFSDLQPLKKIIGDSVRIVLLGEQTHGDGSTFLAKSRLIKFLHKEMGFDVLAFESGLYDCTKAWQLIKEGNDAYKMMSMSVFNLWASTDQCHSLIKYIDSLKLSEHPLELSGFDCQITGSLYAQYLLADFNNLKLNCLSKEEQEDLLEVIHLTANKPLKKDVAIYNNIFDKLLKCIHTKVSGMANEKEPILSNLQFWEHVIDNLKVVFNRRNLDFNTIKMNDPRISIRDIQMGKNIVWLSKYLYSNRKIIVWAANFHNMRNSGEIKERDSSNFRYKDITTMGDVIWNEFGDKIFNIAFTSEEGEYRDITTSEIIRFPESSRGSLEFLLEEAGFEYAFVNFRNLNDKNKWLNDRIVMQLLGHIEKEANWNQIVDAVFFIKTMKPSSY